MKRNILTLGLVVFVLNIALSQKQINIDFNNVIDTVKTDLLGGNKLFDNTYNMLHNEGIKYIRTHDMHHQLDYSDYSDFWNYNGSSYTINQSFDPYNPADYNWQAADSSINVIINNNFNVFFRIGVSYPTQGTLAPPYDAPCNSTLDTFNFSRFASLAKQTYRHYNEGWDNGFNYDITYWELWNEPGGQFFNGLVQQFYSMYKAVCDSLKSYAPNIKLGALGAVPTTTLGYSNHGYRELFLDYCESNNLPLDFYSWHIYGMKNPYVIKAYADTIRNLLNARGFVDAENIISETNSTLDNSLDTLTVSPYGAAYYLSIILTAQIAPLDKLLWYPSCVSSENSRSNFARACFNKVMENTTLIVENDGNIVSNGTWNSYEDNFMVMSSKSTDDSKLYILISNLRSNVTSIKLNINNLPWTSSDSLQISCSIINDQYIYNTTTETIQGDQSLVINNDTCPNPGVLFYQIEKKTNSGINNLLSENVKIYPNPTTQTLAIENIAGYNITVTDVSGKTVFSQLNCTENKLNVDVSNFNKGVYFVKVNDNKNIITKKLIVY